MKQPSPRDRQPHSGRREGQAWKSLKAEFGDRLKEHEDAIYSLPPKLIDALQAVSDRRAGPMFFTAEEEAFERALARTGNGFFLGESFTYPPFAIVPEVAPTAAPRSKKRAAVYERPQNQRLDEERDGAERS